MIHEPLLFDLEADLSETTNLAEKHPNVVAEMLRLAEWAREDIGDEDRIAQERPVLRSTTQAAGDIITVK